MNLILKFLIHIFLLIISVTFAQSLQEGTKKEISTDQLNWLSGYWTAEIDGTKMEELWLSVSNGSMIGIHRDTFKSGKVFFEYLRIEQIGNSIIYFASPQGRKPTRFQLISIEQNKVIFENPEHDFPQRIIYTLNYDTLVARIEGVADSIFKFSQWKWFKSNLGQ